MTIWSFGVMKKTKQEVLSEFRCAEILDAARRVFARKGFTGATVDEIAESAGLAKGTIYLYFHSKRGIFRAVLKQSLAVLLDETARGLSAAATPAEKIRAFIRTRVCYAERNHDCVSIHQFGAGHPGPASLDREFRGIYLQQARALEAVLKEASLRGEIRPIRADAAAFAVHEMTSGLITHRLLGRSRATAEEDVDFLFDLVWSGLSGPSVRAGQEASCTGS